jgi:hypothetical protein
LEAGDIIAIKGNSNSAPLIKIFTFSKWTHVGIAVNSTQILDAIPSKEYEERADVDLVNKADFIKDAEKVIHFKRQPSLTTDQKKRLDEFVKYAKTKKYTRTHAAGTLSLPFYNILLTIFFIPFIALMSLTALYDADLSENVFMHVTKIVTVLVIWIVFFKFVKWSSGNKWKVKEVEFFFQKAKFGSWLVAKKYDMFCSKLVLLAEQAIGGELSPLLPNEDETQPKHIVRACEKLKWEIIDD